jgi:hypothetical protein
LNSKPRGIESATPLGARIARYGNFDEHYLGRPAAQAAKAEAEGEEGYRRLSAQAKESKIAVILLRPDLNVAIFSSRDLRLQHHDK